MGTTEPGRRPGRAPDDEIRALAAWWDAIGAAVADRRMAPSADPHPFAELATSVLVEHPPPMADPVTAALRWMAASPLPAQHNVGTGFGQPAVTVHRGDGFLVYLLFWFDETVTIHDHRFTGAFSILQGISIHSVYRFRPSQRLSAGLDRGELESVSVETLRPGDVRPIHEGSGLIHSNFHFGQPSPTLSVVVRTEADWQTPQHLYTRSGLAFTDGAGDADAAKRRQGMFAAGRVSAELGLDYVRRGLEHTSPEQTLALLTAATPFFGAPALEPLIAVSPLGSSDDLSGRTLRHLHDVQASLIALRELDQLVDPGDRMVMALVAAGTDWDQLDGPMLGPGDGDPRLVLARLVTALTERKPSGKGASPCSLSPAALELARSLPRTRPSPVAGDPAALELATHRVLGPLFRHLLSS